MKRIKKIASLLLAMVMVFAMSVTAFAAEVTPSGELTYQIFQIFTGDLEGTTLSNIKWGSNAASGYTQNDRVSKEVLDELQAVNSATTDTAKLQVIEKYVNLNSTPVNTTDPVKGNDGKFTYGGLTPGYYLVKSTKPLNEDGTVATNEQIGAYTLYVVEVTGNTLSFQPKVDVPTVDKKILDPGEVDQNEASIGDEVNYRITATLPSNAKDFAEYQTYYLKLDDTLSAGLTYKLESAKLYLVNGDNKQEVTIDSNNIKLTVPTVDTTPTADTNIVLEVVDAKQVANVVAGSKFVLEYTAILNENAVVAPAGNPNTVKLTYSNNPNYRGEGKPGEPDSDYPTGVTPEKEVVTYTTELKITKRDGNTNDILTGAEFTLSGEGYNVGIIKQESFREATDGTYYKLKDQTYTEEAPTPETADSYESTEVKYKKEVNLITSTKEGEKTSIKAEVNEKGEVIFRGLGAGEYTLTESKTPAGYNTMQPKKIEIGFKYENNAPLFSINNVGATNEVGDSGLSFTGTPDSETEGKIWSTTFATDILNFSGSTLPSTGGIGTTIFYVVGGILVIGAGILLVTKRRMKAQ